MRVEFVEKVGAHTRRNIGTQFVVDYGHPEIAWFAPDAEAEEGYL